VAAPGEEARSSRGRHRSGADGTPEPGATGAKPEPGATGGKPEPGATGGKPEPGAAAVPMAGAARAEALAAEAFGAEILPAQARVTEVSAARRAGGAAPAGLSREVNGRPVTNIPPRSTPPRSTPPRSTRPDTLPDWRPGPGSFDPPAAGAGSGAKTAPAARPAGRLERLLSARGWPLAFVLAVQAALSLRLVWSATAFIDEGLYLSVGHLELGHFLHGAAMPDVASFMSGSPVVYPPLAALADDIGGLAGARLLSLVFMLIARSCCTG